ncbi:MAG: DUF547 domain-containing protein [Rhizobacter sp.]|nr:DUF547 domain-containing protein [Chlorobiales bacterium]
MLTKRLLLCAAALLIASGSLHASTPKSMSEPTSSRTLAADAPDHAPFTEALGKHVKNGKVDYKGFKGDKQFAAYIESLKKVDPYAIDAKERLAYWLNVYNAFTIKVVMDNYPLKSIKDLGEGNLVVGTIFKSTVWDRKNVDINGKTYSLNDIENNIIRKTGDPRVHFAMVCAAKSCPPLRTEAYEPSKLNAQLEDQGRTFMAQTSKNRFDFAKKEATISNIFNWFKGDFEKTGQPVLEYLARFLPKEQGEQLKTDSKSFKVDYTEYDWSLNE